MKRYYRVVTPRGELILVEEPNNGVAGLREIYSWVDSEPLDLRPAEYACDQLVQMHDRVCAGGDEFTVTRLEPSTMAYPKGRVRGAMPVWYDVRFVVLLSRADDASS